MLLPVRRSISGYLLVFVVLSLHARARAQSAGPALASPSADASPCDCTCAEPRPLARGPMGRGGVGARIGVGGYVVPAGRHGSAQPFSPQLQLTLSFYMGGDGLGWTVETSMAGGAIRPGIDYGDRERHFYLSMAVYTGPTFQLRVAERAYVGFGTGGRTGFARYRNEAYAHPLVELGVRVPVSTTYYLRPELALALELAAGANRAMSGEEDFNYVSYEAGLGVRWP